MARTKVTFEDLTETFEQAKVFLKDGAQIFPMKGDDSKVLLINGEAVQTYSCMQLRSNLKFLSDIMSERV